MPRLRYASVMVLVALLSLGCAGGPTETTAPESPAAGESAPTETTAPGSPAAGESVPAPDDQPFVLGYASTPSISDLPVYIALDTMRDQGYDASATEVASFDILYGALATNEIQLAGSDPVLGAQAAATAEIHPVVARANNLWAMVSLKGYADCQSWNGEPFGIFSQQSITYIYTLAYIEAECPGVTPQEVTIADSALRVVALQNDEIVATFLDSTGAPQLLATDDCCELVASLNQSIDFGREMIHTNGMVLEERRGALEAFIQAELEAIRYIYANPDELISLAEEHLPAQLGENPEAVADYVLENEGWCANGGLGDDNVALSLEAAVQYEIVDEIISPEEFIDDEPLNTVLAQIGESDETEC